MIDTKTREALNNFLYSELGSRAGVAASAVESAWDALGYDLDDDGLEALAAITSGVLSAEFHYAGDSAHGRARFLRLVRGGR